MTPPRAYADTSVFGGILDEEFSETSKAFFEQVRNGRFKLLSSVLVKEELSEAPKPVNELFLELVPQMELVPVNSQAVDLQEKYLGNNILPRRWADDALHVALASIARASVLVSWNFRHIVHFEKIPLYNAVNLLNGLGEISIHSPEEVIAYEDKDV